MESTTAALHSLSDEERHRLLDTAKPSWIFVAIVLSVVPHDLMYGPQAALIAEAFTGRLRYSGASLGYQLASVIAGGPAPLIATALFAHYKSGYAIAGCILVCAIVKDRRACASKVRCSGKRAKSSRAMEYFQEFEA